MAEGSTLVDTDHHHHEDRREQVSTLLNHGGHLFRCKCKECVTLRWKCKLALSLVTLLSSIIVFTVSSSRSALVRRTHCQSFNGKASIRLDYDTGKTLDDLFDLIPTMFPPLPFRTKRPRTVKPKTKTKKPGCDDDDDTKSTTYKPPFTPPPLKPWPKRTPWPKKSTQRPPPPPPRPPTKGPAPPPTQRPQPVPPRPPPPKQTARPEPPRPKPTPPRPSTRPHKRPTAPIKYHDGKSTTVKPTFDPYETDDPDSLDYPDYSKKSTTTRPFKKCPPGYPNCNKNMYPWLKATTKSPYYDDYADRTRRPGYDQYETRRPEYDNRTTRRPRRTTRSPDDYEDYDDTTTRKPRRTTRHPYYKDVDDDYGDDTTTRKPRRTTRQPDDYDDDDYTTTRRPRKTTMRPYYKYDADTDEDEEYSTTKRPRRTTKAPDEDEDDIMTTRKPRKTTKRPDYKDEEDEDKDKDRDKDKDKKKGSGGGNIFQDITNSVDFDPFEKMIIQMTQEAVNLCFNGTSFESQASDIRSVGRKKSKRKSDKMSNELTEKYRPILKGFFKNKELECPRMSDHKSQSNDSNESNDD